ncbi:hypothetical protein A374_07479 [Fictibacillus macauensis ZFHKF-1]|uniref:HTH arsR-type domain-containing protein n=1 Tax=Fictibacillus macauensis ZFHKF-1 TaxID=1196324 RepID=I8AJG8_9BACL|nr:winged helix-turn-helix domain-containing protein [Fictibacillus macauensis]EIT85659.1 hypothetical protein A374_07479 [Fictibacillus macauensis ZFHKF-1]
MQVKPNSIELMKIFSDPRRLQILHAALDEPITVKQLAIELNEQPSRLYYHVKKLEEADLLEVTETKQLGNLTEKYYQTVNMKDTLYRGSPQIQAEQPEVTLSLTYQLIQPALTLLEKSLEEIRKAKEQNIHHTSHLYQFDISSVSDRLTAQEWADSIPKIIQMIAKKDENTIPLPSRTFTEEEGKEQGTYQYVLLSYRLEDVEHVKNENTKKPPL